MQTVQRLKADIISTLDVLPLEGLSLLAEFVAFLREKFKQLEPIEHQATNEVDRGAKKEPPILAVAGSWKGDDFEDCLEAVYQFRGKAQF